MELFVLGLNHDTASIDLRERLFFPERELPKALDALGEVPELVERMILTTCNRVEVYGVAEGALSQTLESVVACLGRHRGLDPAQFDGAFYTHTAADAAGTSSGSPPAWSPCPRRAPDPRAGQVGLFHCQGRAVHRDRPE